MGIFSRKKGPAASSEPTNGSPGFIGRKFLSSLSIQECLGNFSALKDECYATVGATREVEWQMPVGLPERTSQGMVPTVPPDRVVASDLVGGGQICLALWDSGVSHGPAKREMWFVPSGFDRSPIPIAGRWKMRDGSLSSIGWVESALWGVR